MASVLCICDQGYRASIEEQDDTVVWMAHMLQQNESTDAALVLRGSAVNYAYKHQRCAGVRFGDWEQKHPADLPRDLARFVDDGGRVYVLREDLAAHGLGEDDLVESALLIDRDKLGALVDEFDSVSFW